MCACMYVSVCLFIYKIWAEHERFWKIYKSAGWVERNLVPLLWFFENTNPRVESAGAPPGHMLFPWLGPSTESRYMAGNYLGLGNIEKIQKLPCLVAVNLYCALTVTPESRQNPC